MLRKRSIWLMVSAVLAIALVYWEIYPIARNRLEPVVWHRIHGNRATAGSGVVTLPPRWQETSFPLGEQGFGRNPDLGEPFGGSISVLEGSQGEVAREPEHIQRSMEKLVSTLAKTDSSAKLSAVRLDWNAGAIICLRQDHGMTLTLFCSVSGDTHKFSYLGSPRYESEAVAILRSFNKQDHQLVQ